MRENRHKRLHIVWLHLYEIYRVDKSMLLLLSHFSHVRLCVTPIDGSPPGSPVPGILQARTLEWVAISFSTAWKWKVKVKSLSRIRLLATPWPAAYQTPLSVGFSRQEYSSGLPLPFPIHGHSSLDYWAMKTSTVKELVIKKRRKKELVKKSPVIRP